MNLEAGVSIVTVLGDGASGCRRDPSTAMNREATPKFRDGASGCNWEPSTVINRVVIVLVASKFGDGVCAVEGVGCWNGRLDEPCTNVG